MSLKNLCFSILLLLSFAGCQQRGLSARLEGWNRAYLASSKVHTPDPRQCGYCGQQIVANWYFPGCYANPKPLTLCISYITGIHTFQKVSVPVYSNSGVYALRFLNEEFRKIRGILSYKVEMFEGDTLLSCWKLPTYVEWIHTEED